MNFFEKFFGYYRYNNNQILGLPEPYQDQLGLGSFSDPRHYLLMIIIVCLAIGLFLLFKKHPKIGGYFIYGFSLIMILGRVINVIYRLSIGAYPNGFIALPWDLAEMLALLLPIVVFFKLEKLKSPVYSLSIIVGIILIIIGDYFNNQFINFYTFEKLFYSSLLILIPIIQIGIEGFKFEFKDIWLNVTGFAIGIALSLLGNFVIFVQFNPNFMYLNGNPFPNQFMGGYYWILLGVIYVLLLVVIYSMEHIIKFIKSKGCKSGQ